MWGCGRTGKQMVYTCTIARQRVNSRKTNNNIRSKHHNQQYIDKLVDLYNIHHSSNYRTAALSYHHHK